MKKLFLPVLFLCLAGCRAKSDLPPGAGASPAPLPPPVVVAPVDDDLEDTTPQAGTLKFSLAADRTTMKRGDTVTFTMTLTNEGKKDAKLLFFSGQDFDVRARLVGSEETAWSWSMDKMFTQALRNKSLAAGKSVVYTATWDGTAGGNRLPRGAYEIVAFTACKPRVESPSIKISVD